VDLGDLLLAAWMGMGKPGKGGLPPGERDEFEQYLQQRTCTTRYLEGLMFLTWADIKEDRTDSPGQDANWVSDRTFSPA
jgi:hypothetical protein